MPGLVGLVSRIGIDRSLLDNMARSIKHEDWYHTDSFVESFCGVVRVDLGVFNPEPQPVYNEDRQVCIIMYGKIYGYEEGLKELVNRGHRFTVSNDADFCLHLYEEKGDDFVKDLNGTFAIVIYDIPRKRLLLANDRHGLRPIYYSINDDRLLFASEVKAILQDGSFRKTLNDEAIADFFNFGKLLGDKTFFNGIEVLPPSSILTYSETGINIRQYWELSYRSDYKISEEEIIERLVDSFRRAVNIRLSDDIRYGVTLSGGLDSRSIVAAIDEEKREAISTFNFGIKGGDEDRIAERVALSAGTKHYFIEMNPNEILTHAREAVYLSDGMNTVAVSYIPYAYEHVRAKSDVVFTALALDLLLGGSFIEKGLIKAKSRPERTELAGQRRLFTAGMLRSLFKAGYSQIMENLASDSINKVVENIHEEHPANLLDHFSLENHVRRTTILGSIIARTRVEEAIPSYDNDFIDLVQKVPPEQRFGHRIYRKFLMRLSPEMAAIPYNHNLVVPKAPLWLWKAGLYRVYGREAIRRIARKASGGRVQLPNRHVYVDYERWFRSNEGWKRFIMETILDEKALSREMFDQDYIQKLVAQHNSGRFDNSRTLAHLVTFELFLKMFT